MDSHASAWPLELGIRTPTLWRGLLVWGYGLPRFGLEWGKLQMGWFPISTNGYVVLQLMITTLRCSMGCAQMAKLPMGRFPISTNGYVALQLMITTLQCSMGCAQMAKLQMGRFPISKNG